MFVMFRLAAVRREKIVCVHSDIVTVGIQVARYQLVRDVNQYCPTGGATSTELCCTTGAVTSTVFIDRWRDINGLSVDR